MHASIFLWGFTGILGRLITLNEGLLVWYRMLITITLMLLIFGIGGKLHRIDRKSLVRIAIAGTLIAFHWLFFYGAIKYSNVSVTLSCLASTALFTSLGDSIYNRKKNGGFKFNPMELLFAGMAILGIYLVFAFQANFILGILFALIAALLGASFTLVNKELMEQHEAESVCTYELICGFIVLSLFMPLYNYKFPAPHYIPASSDLVYLFLLSFFCTVIPFTLSLKSLKVLSAFTANLTLNLEPVYGILLAFAVFHEQTMLHKGFYYGTGIILGSVFLHAALKLTKKKREVYLD